MLKNKNHVAYTDGFIEIYTTENKALPGDMPVESFVNKRKAYFKSHTVGFGRFYSAMQEQVRISKAVLIPEGVEVREFDVAFINGGKEKYLIRQVQEKKEQRSLLLSLERIDINATTEV